jgi:hypothetical protein
MRSLSPTEAQEQEALFERADFDTRLQAMFSIPNDGKRSVWEGARFKARGLKPGVPDIFLPVAIGGYHGCFIEMKRKNPPGKVTAEQHEWLTRLSKNGYYTAVAWGYEQAWKIIEGYLEMKA